ncbi:MAG: EamA family transporter [Ralstonia sp.]|nr:EamA family transporter [Ralstonia sp.]
MNLVTFGLILTGVMLNACAQLLLKAGVNNIGRFAFSADNILPIGIKLATQWPIVGGLSCYVISVVVWILGLSRVDVTIAYPMLSLGYIATAIGAYLFLGEVVSVQRMVAMAVIIVGVALMART